jgi:hypothetical protein
MDRASACPSPFRLDEHLAGELGPGEAEGLERHLSGCERCGARLGAVLAEREQFRATAPPLLLPVPRDRAPGPATGEVIPLAGARPGLARGRARRAAFALAPLGLAAAALLLVVGLRGGGPEPELPWRPKGRAQLAVFVRHGDEVRAAAPGEIVAPGDALQFAFTRAAGRFVAVLSRDGAGKASVYFPLDGRAAAVGATGTLESTNSVVLDDVLGRETLYGLSCAGPTELEPLRAALETRSAPTWPAGCTAVPFSVDKRPASDARPEEEPGQ